MFKLRSISARVILTISLTVAVACGILGTFSIVQQRALMRLALDQQLKLQYDSVMAALDYEGRAALAVSAVIANLPPVGDAIAKGERDPLMTLLQGSLAAIKPQGMPLISFQTPPATNFFRIHEPKIFGDDISARRKTVVESNTTGKPIVGVEPGRDSLGVFGMTPIMRDGKSIGVVDIGVSFGKPFVDNAKRRFGVDLTVYRFDGKGFANIASTLDGSLVATQDELKNVYDGSALRRDATLNGHPAALYLGQIKNYAGQPVAVIELLKDTTEYEAAAANSQRTLILGTLAILAGDALHVRCGLRNGADHALDVGFEAVGHLALQRSFLDFGLLFGDVLRFAQRAGLDHVAAEHVHGHRHGAEFVFSLATGNRHVDITAREPVHHRGNGRQRTR